MSFTPITHAKTPSSTLLLLLLLRARLLLRDRCASPRLLLFDRLDDDLCLDEERFLELLRLERLALIFLCIMARRLRRLVKRIPRNMKRLPMRHNVPRAYFALLATLKLAIVCPADAMVLIFPEEALEIRSLFWQREESSALHALLEETRAPAAE